MVCVELPNPSLLLFPQHLPWWRQSCCRCNWPSNRRRQASRNVLGQGEGPAGPYNPLPWTSPIQLPGSEKTKTTVSLSDSEQRCEPRTLCQTVSHWQGVMILATLSISLSCQTNSILYQIQTCTQQEKRKLSLWTDRFQSHLSHRSQIRTPEGEEMYQQSHLCPANPGNLKCFVSTQMWPRLIINIDFSVSIKQFFLVYFSLSYNQAIILD